MSHIEEKELDIFTSMLTCHWMQLPLGRNIDLGKASLSGRKPSGSSAVSCQPSTFLAAGERSGASGFTAGWFTAASTKTHTLCAWIHLFYISSLIREKKPSRILAYLFSYVTSQGQGSEAHCPSPLLAIPDSPLASSSAELGGVLWQGDTGTTSEPLVTGLFLAMAAPFINLPSKLIKELPKDTELDNFGSKHTLLYLYCVTKAQSSQSKEQSQLPLPV